MKQLLYSLGILALTTLAACSKGSGGSTPTPATRTLNSTETSLVGHWELDRKTDTIWSYNNGTYTYATSINDTSFDYTSYWDFRTDTCVFTTNIPQALRFQRSLSGTPSEGYWYYDNTINKLRIGIEWSKILTLTSSSLIVRFEVESIQQGMGSRTYSYYFLHK